MAALAANPTGPPELLMAKAVGDNVQFDLRVFVQKTEQAARQEEYTVNKVVTQKTPDGKTVQRVVPEIRVRTVNYTTVVPAIEIHTKSFPASKIAAVSTDQKLLNAEQLKGQLSDKRPVLVLFSDYDLDPEFVRLFGPGQLILKVNEKRNNFMAHRVRAGAAGFRRPNVAPAGLVPLQRAIPAQKLLPLKNRAQNPARPAQ